MCPSASDTGWLPLIVWPGLRRVFQASLQFSACVLHLVKIVEQHAIHSVCFKSSGFPIFLKRANLFGQLLSPFEDHRPLQLSWRACPKLIAYIYLEKSRSPRRELSINIRIQRFFKPVRNKFAVGDLFARALPYENHYCVVECSIFHSFFSSRTPLRRQHETINRPGSLASPMDIDATS